MFRYLTFNKTKSLRPFWLSLTVVAVLTLVSMIFTQHAYSASAQATVGWTADTGTVSGYTVYWGSSSGNYTGNANAGNNTTYTISSLPGPTGYVAVTAYNSSNVQSGYSPELVVEQLSASAGSGGSISPTGTFFQTQGASQTFTITPSSGYQVSSVTVDGVSAGAVTTYTFSNITASHTISATFAAQAAGTYTISASAGSNGTISPSGAVSVTQGASQTFTITPSSGYQVSSVTVDGVSAGAVTTYTFSSVAANHTISATFAAQAASTYTISASAGSNGTISPSGAVSVKSGANQSFAITPSSGYQVSSVTVDGVSAGAVTTYTFSSVAANHTISAAFSSQSASTYTITATAGSNGSISPPGSVSVKAGANQAFAITPASGCQISSVAVDGTSVGAVASYTFSSVAANHTISAAFKTKRSRRGYGAVSSTGSSSSLASVAVSPAASQASTITPTGGSQVSSAPVSGLVADPGPNQTVAPGTKVTLNGSNSADQGGPGIASYLWTQVSGNAVSLLSPSAAQATFTAPEAQSGEALTFQLTVTDRNGSQASDTCIVNVTLGSAAPSAKVGADQTVSELTIVTLNGSESTDPDNAISSYAWQQIDGPAVALSDANSPQPTFAAPEVASGAASLSFKLTVTNSSGLKSTAKSLVNVTQAEAAPTASAGTARTVSAGSTVKLTGSGSAASDDTVASLHWHQISGAPVTLSDPASATPTFTAKKAGQYNNPLTFGLTVEDVNGLRSSATQVITVK